MFFLDPLFDKNLFDAFYAYQFCQLIRQTSESMNKEVISVNQEMEKINRLVFIKLMLRHFDTETSWRYKPSPSFDVSYDFAFHYFDFTSFSSVDYNELKFIFI